MPISAPTDKRFRRAHVNPVRRRRVTVPAQRLVAVALMVVAFCFAAYWGVGRMLTAEALTITRITVRGSTPLSNADVISRLDGIRGQHMLSVDLDVWQQWVLESPWVETVAIRRVLPSSVDVAITERRPMAVGRIGTELYLIGDRGEIIDRFGPDHAAFDLPLVEGLAPRRRQSPSPTVDEDNASLAARFIAALRERPDLAERVSEIDVTDPHNAVIILKGDTTLIRVGEEQFAERLQLYLDVAPAIRDQEPQVDYVDVRFGERVTVGPRSSRGPTHTVAASGGG